jgi:hypothetical protein
VWCFSRSTSIFPVSIIPPMLHLIHSSTTDVVQYFSPCNSVSPVNIISPKRRPHSFIYHHAV